MITTCDMVFWHFKQTCIMPLTRVSSGRQTLMCKKLLTCLYKYELIKQVCKHIEHNTKILCFSLLPRT